MTTHHTALSSLAQLDANPDDLSVIAHLERTLGAAGQWEALVAGLTDRAAAGVPAPTAARLLLEAARLAALRLGDVDRSAALITQAYEHATDHAVAYELQLFIFALQQDWDGLQEFSSQALEATDDALFQSRIYRMLGLIIAEILEDAAQSQEMYTAAIQLDPKGFAARWGLVELLSASGKWAEAAALLFDAVQQTEDPALQIGLMLDLGEVYLHRLEDAESAAQCFANVYEYDATNARAIAGLRAIGYDIPDADAADAPEAAPEAATPPAPPTAPAPADPPTVEFSDAMEVSETLDGAELSLVDETPAEAPAPPTPPAAPAAEVEVEVEPVAEAAPVVEAEPVAEIEVEPVADVEVAPEAEPVVEAEPVAEIEPIADLEPAPVSEATVDAAPAPEPVAEPQPLADADADADVDADANANANANANADPTTDPQSESPLSGSPGEGPGGEAPPEDPELEFEEDGPEVDDEPEAEQLSWEDRFERLESALVSADDAEKRTLIGRMARLEWLNRRGTAYALRTWEAAVAHGVAGHLYDTYSFRYENAPLWRDIFDMAEQAGADAGLLAQIALYNLHDFDRARGLVADGQPAEVAQILEDEAEARDNWRKFQRTVEQRFPDAERDERNLLVYTYLMKFGEALDDSEKVFDALRRLDRLTDDFGIKGRYQIVHRDTAKWPAYVDILKAEAEGLPAELIEDKVDLLFEAVRVYRDEINNPMQAISAYKEILEIDPQNMRAIDDLIQLYGDVNRAKDQVDMLEQKAAMTRGLKRRVAIKLEIASLYIDKFRNQNGAAEVYEQILADDPKNATAVAFLKDYYPQRREWEKLIDLYKLDIKRLERAERIERLKFIAQLATDNIRKPELPVELWEDVLATAPRDLDALDALEQLHERGTRDYAALAHVLERKAALLTTPSAQLELYQKLGTLYTNNLDEPSRAIVAWEAALAIDSDDLKTRKSLERLYTDHARWDALERFYAEKDQHAELVRTFEKLAGSQPDDGDKIDLLLRAARAWKAPLDDVTRAERALDRVLALDPANEAAALELEPIYAARDDAQGLLNVFQIILGHRDVADRRPYQEKLARLHEGPLDDAAAALEWYARIFLDDANRLDALDDIERTAGRAGSWPRAVVLIRDGLERFELDEDTRHTLKLRAARVLASELGKYDDAQRQLEEILDATPDHVDALGALARIFTAQERWDDLMSVYARRLDLVDNDADRVQILQGMAKIAEEQADDPARAIATLTRAQTMLPDEATTLDELHRLYRQQAQWDELADILRHKIQLATARGTVEALPEVDEDVEPLADVEVARRMGADLLRPAPEDLIALADLRHELGLVCRDHLGLHPEAIGSLGRALILSLDHEDSIDALETYLDDAASRLEVARILEPVYTYHGRWHALIRALRIMVEEAPEAADKIVLLERVAALHIERVMEPSEAFDTYGEILHLDPAHALARQQLHTIADSLDLWPSLITLYEDVLPSIEPGDDALRIDYDFTLAALHLERAEATGPAEHYLRDVLEVQRDNHDALNALDALYQDTEQWESLREITERKLELAEDPDEIRALRFRIASLWEELLDAPDEAISALQRVTEEHPEDLDAIRALNRLFAQQSHWEDLAEGYERELTLVEDHERLDIKNSLANVLTVHLGRHHEAVDLYEEVLAASPGHPDAVAALEARMAASAEDEEIPAQRISLILEPLFDALADWDKLVWALEVQTLHAFGEDDKIELLHRISDLHEGSLDQPGEAFAAQVRALRINPEHPHTLEKLYALAATLDDYGALVRALEAEADEQVDVDIKRMLLRRAAQIYQSVLDDERAAADRLREVLDHAPADLESIQDLERLYHGLGDMEQLVQITLAHAELVQHDSPDDARELYYQAGVIYDELLERPEDAIDVFNTVRHVIDNSDPTSLERLIDLHMRLEQWEALQEILTLKLDLEHDADAQKELLYASGQVYRERMEQPEEAIATFSRLVQLDPDELDAHKQLDELYQETERWLDLVENLEAQIRLTEDAPARHHLMWRVGRIWEEQQGDGLNAITTYNQILTEAPDHEPTLAALEGMVDRGDFEVEAAEALRPVLEAFDQWARLVRVYRMLLVATDDPFRRLEIYREIGRIEEQELGDQQAAFATFSQAAGEAPEDAELVDTYERLAAALGAWDPFIDRLDAIIEGAMDPEVQTALQLRIARAYEHEIRDAGAAIDRYDRVLESDPQNQPAVEALDRLYMSEGKYADLEVILQRRVDMTFDPDARVLLLMRLGQVQRDMLERPEDALQTYDAILRDDPTRQEALDELESMFLDGHAQDAIRDLIEPLYGARGDHERTIGLYQQRLEGLEDRDARFDLFRHIARLYQQELADDRAAIPALAGALVERPADDEIMAELDRIAEDHGAWGEVAMAYYQSTESPHLDDTTALTTYLRYGTIVADHLQMPDDAEGAWTLALELDPGQPTALVQLDTLYSRQLRHAELAEILRRRTAGDLEDDALVDANFRLAETYRLALEQDAEAIERYDRVLAIEPEHLPSLEALEAIYQSQGAWAELYGVLDRQVPLIYDGDRQSSVLGRMAQIAEEALEDRAAAIGLWHRVRDLRYDDPEPLAQLNHLYTLDGSWDELIHVIDDQITLATDPATRRDLYASQGVLWTEHLNQDPDDSARRAQDAWQNALAIDPEHLQSLEALRVIYNDQRDYAALADVLYRLLDHDALSHERKLDLWVEQADLQSDLLFQPDRAIEAWRQVLLIDPSHASAIENLERLYKQEHLYEDVLGILELRADLEDDAEARIALYRELAAICEEQLGQRDRAVPYYQSILAIDPHDADAFESLDDTFRYLGTPESHTALATLYRSHAQLFDEDLHERTTQLIRAAEVYEQLLNEPQNAQLVLHEALMPQTLGDERIFDEICRLAEITGMWQAVAEHHSGMLQGLTEADTAEAFVIYKRIGVLLADHIGDTENAVAYLEYAHQYNDQDLDTLKRVEALYELHGLWVQLAEALKLIIALEEDPIERAEQHRKLGVVTRDQLLPLALQQTDAAVTQQIIEQSITAFQAVLQIDEGDLDAIVALEQLFEHFERWHELVDILAHKVERVVGEDEIIAIYGRMALVHESRLGDQAQAVQAYEDLLTVNPVHLEALAQLERIHGGAERWEDVLTVYQRQLDATPSLDGKREIYGKIAMLHEELFSQPVEAIEAYRNIRALAPEDLNAIEHLERLFASQHMWFELVDTYEDHLRLVQEPSAQTRLLNAEARTYRDKIQDPHAAIDAFLRSLRASAEQPDVLRELGALYEGQAEWLNAVGAYQRLATQLFEDERVELLQHTGKLLEERVGDEARAEQIYGQALQLQSGYRPAIEALRLMFTRQQRWQDVIQILKQAQETTRDLREQGTFLAAIADVYHYRLSDPTSEVSAIRYYEQAYEQDPELLSAIEPLIDVYTEGQRWERALPLLQRAIEHYQTHSTPTEKVHKRYLQMAQTCEHLQLRDQAVDFYYRAYEQNPNDRDTLLGLARQLFEQGDMEQAYKLFQTLHMNHINTLTVEQQHEVLYASGVIKQRTGDRRRAIQFFELAYKVFPQHKETLNALLENCESSESWDRYIELMYSLVQAESEPALQLAHLTKVGDIYNKNLRQPQQAVAAYLRALELEPHNIALLRKLLDLYTRMKQWIEAVEILKRLIENEQDPERKAKFAYTIGVIYRDEIRDMNEAVEFFELALDIDLSMLKAFEAVDRILTEGKAWKRLERSYRHMLHRISQEEGEEYKALSILLWRNLGEIYRTRLGHVQSAVQAFDMAAALQPGNEEIHLILAQLHEKQENPQGVIAQHRELIKLNPFRIDSYRALFKAYAQAREFDKAWCMASALAFLQSAKETEQRFYEQYASTTPPTLRSAISPEMFRHIYHPEQDLYISAIMRQLSVVFGPAYGRSLRDLGINQRKDMLNLDEPLAFATKYRTTGQLLAPVGLVPIPQVFMRRDQAIGMRNANAHDERARVMRAFIVGADVLQGHDERDLAFIIAKQLCWMLPEHYLGSCGHPTEYLKTFFMFAMDITDPELGIGPSLGPNRDSWIAAMNDADQQVSGYILQVQKLTRRFLNTGRNPNLSYWLTQVDHTTTRFGLLVCGDLHRAARCIQNDTNPVGKATVKEKIRELVLFSISEEYFELRRQLGIAIA